MFHVQKLGFETELREKDQQIYRITVQYNEVENELQRSKTALLKQQQISEHHLNEVTLYLKYFENICEESRMIFLNINTGGLESVFVEAREFDYNICICSVFVKFIRLKFN